MDPLKARKYYELAKFQASLFSKDPNTKVASILLAHDSFQILSTGFNGIARGLAETPERWERPTKYKWVVHAELNAIVNAARSGTSIEGAICVVTMFPCVECCKAIIQAGIDTVVAPAPDLSKERYEWATSIEMFREAGVTVLFMPAT